MKFFRKKTKPLTARQEAVAGKIAAGLLNGQRRLADHLNRKTAHLTARARICLLLLFCLAFGGYCLFVIISAWH